MMLLDQIAEARIAGAMRNGAFENLPGQGKPLTLHDDRQVPESLRVAYRVLKNSGFLPIELSLRSEINAVRELLADGDHGDGARLSKRLNYLLLKLGQECRRDTAFVCGADLP
ncbi:MAG: DUF1992 domain-containing protein [Gammaproteobacteria bacterium]|nr:DUF1992 domain-containing protein [Gammaproteobacteria bacterium]